MGGYRTFSSKKYVKSNNHDLYFLSKKSNIPKENPIFEDN